MSKVGMTAEEARELRGRLASFAREWGDPRMDDYDTESSARWGRPRRVPED